jgi:hypothetical protein
MVKLGELNSRMKDFYDIWILSERYAFDGKTLSIAISKTFANRKTVLGEDFQCFTPEFAKSKQKQWEAFHRRTLGNSEFVSRDFLVIIENIKIFLMSLVLSLTLGKAFDKRWNFSDRKWG